jgi:hypothetical protein
MFYSALFFNTASAMALKNIRIVRKTNNKDKVKAINKKWWHANKDFIKLKKELLCQEK